jgi:hypothetical protein
VHSKALQVVVIAVIVILATSGVITFLLDPTGPYVKYLAGSATGLFFLSAALGIFPLRGHGRNRLSGRE